MPRVFYNLSPPRIATSAEKPRTWLTEKDEAVTCILDMGLVSRLSQEFEHSEESKS